MSRMKTATNLSKKIMKNMVYIVYENDRSTGRAKRHYQVLIMTVSCPKCCLLDIFCLNSNLIITKF